MQTITCTFKKKEGDKTVPITDGAEYEIMPLTKLEQIEIHSEYSDSFKPNETIPAGQRSISDTLIASARISTAVMSRVLVGWSGLKNKHLVEILDIEKEWEFPGKGKEEDVPYNEGNLSLIVKNFSLEFFTDCITPTLTHAAELLKQKKLSQLKN